MSECYSGILEDMTIDDVCDLQANVCVIPIGSTEPHGPALPYGTDSYRAEVACYGGTRRANELGGRVICLPTQRISLNNNFRAFPFACRMAVRTFMSLIGDLVEMCESEGVRRVVIVNAHGGNPDAIRASMRDLSSRDGAFVCLIHATTCASPEAQQVWENRSDHAGEEETSQILYLRPELVREDKITDNPRVNPVVDVLKEFKTEFVRPWHLYLPTSAGGDARKSSAEKGQIVYESAIDGMGRFLAGLSKAPDSETFPY